MVARISKTWYSSVYTSIPNKQFRFSKSGTDSPHLHSESETGGTHFVQNFQNRNGRCSVQNRNRYSSIGRFGTLFGLSWSVFTTNIQFFVFSSSQTLLANSLNGHQNLFQKNFPQIFSQKKQKVREAQYCTRVSCH